MSFVYNEAVQWVKKRTTNKLGNDRNEEHSDHKSH